MDGQVELILRLFGEIQAKINNLLCSQDIDLGLQDALELLAELKFLNEFNASSIDRGKIAIRAYSITNKVADALVETASAIDAAMVAILEAIGDNQELTTRFAAKREALSAIRQYVTPVPSRIGDDLLDKELLVDITQTMLFLNGGYRFFLMKILELR